jgi:hypothetical protein
MAMNTLPISAASTPIKITLVAARALPSWPKIKSWRV